MGGRTEDDGAGKKSREQGRVGVHSVAEGPPTKCTFVPVPWITLSFCWKVLGGESRGSLSVANLVVAESPMRGATEVRRRMGWRCMLSLGRGEMTRLVEMIDKGVMTGE